jgi:hypothetical protein
VPSEFLSKEEPQLSEAGGWGLVNVCRVSKDDPLGPVAILSWKMMSARTIDLKALAETSSLIVIARRTSKSSRKVSKVHEGNKRSCEFKAFEYEVLCSACRPATDFFPVSDLLPSHRFV